MEICLIFGGCVHGHWSLRKKYSLMPHFATISGAVGGRAWARRKGRVWRRRRSIAVIMD